MKYKAGLANGFVVFVTVSKSLMHVLKSSMNAMSIYSDSKNELVDQARVVI